jgi:hypothetical protein
VPKLLATSRRPGTGAAPVLCSHQDAAADMASQYRIDRDRGTKEFSQQLAVLRTSG